MITALGMIFSDMLEKYIINAKTKNRNIVNKYAKNTPLNIFTRFILVFPFDFDFTPTPSSLLYFIYQRRGNMTKSKRFSPASVLE